MKRIISPLLSLIMFICLSAPQGIAADKDVIAAQKQRIEMIQRVRPSVVAIFGPAGGGGGSGVLITADGYALSNFHVTSGAGNYMRCGLNDGKLYDAVIVGIDPSGDVALIKLLGREDFPTSPMGDSDLLRAGDGVYAMGNPFLLATDYSPTVTYGIVSGVHRYQYPSSNAFLEYADCIQTDASINPGNSGGPLFNEVGEVIGINGRGSFEKRGRVNSGAGYAISINQIKKFLDHLKSGRIVDHATLGASVMTSEDGRVVIDQILESSEAFRRGLRTGDEIVSFGGRPIGSVNQFKNVLGTYPNGWKVPLSYRREDQKKVEIIVRLQPLHRKAALIEASGKKKTKKLPKGHKPVAKPQKTKSLPKKYSHMLVEKTGFMNYYFNEQAQAPLIKSIDSWGNFSNVSGRWNLDCTLSNRAKVSIAMNNEAAVFRIDEREFLLSIGEPETYSEPPESNGLLQALFQLREFLINKKKNFVEFHYIGGEPMDGTGQPVNVLQTLKDQSDCRWYFDKKTNNLLGFDLILSPFEDPCSIRIDEMQTLGDRQFIRKISVFVGDKLFDTITINSAEFLADDSKEEKN